VPDPNAASRTGRAIGDRLQDVLVAEGRVIQGLRGWLEGSDRLQPSACLRRDLALAGSQQATNGVD
jgi:hypothetical protein